MARLLPKRVDVFAREYLGLIQSGSVESAMGFLVPSLQNASARPEFLKMASVLKTARIDSAEVVGINVNNAEPAVHTSVTYQLRADTAWVLGSVTVVEDPSGTGCLTTCTVPLRVEGVSARFMHQSLETANALTFSDKPGSYGAFAVIAILIVLFNFSVAVMAVRSRIRRRWLWAALSLVGFGAVTLNWTTGNLAFQPINVQLFGAGILKAGLYAPWVASFSFPMMAVIVLVKVRRASRTGNEPGPPPVLAP
ncbi:MAG TPA: hypothetical protein VEV39_12140 [Gemmatimonadales bacterium]|nr:hypothetical protein [Gemmatimonadales bacterium]